MSNAGTVPITCRTLIAHKWTYAPKRKHRSVLADIRQCGGELFTAVSTNILHVQARVLVATAGRSHVGTRTSGVRGLERRPLTVDDHPRADYETRAEALRSSASRSRPAHRERHRRHGSRRPALDGPGVAPHRTKGRSQP